jgi:hypothetical protein
MVKPATLHITERSTPGEFERSSDCAECYDAKWLKPSPKVRDYLRPWFTIRRPMVLVCAWAVPSAVVVWSMDQIRAYSLAQIVCSL